jgi:DNA-directed RNA polymerase subunit RPC12/RpoP
VSPERTYTCAHCGAEVSPEVPEYFIELECFRIIDEREGETPRRGSSEYQEAMEKLSPEIKAAYFKNPEMYDNGHLWCPMCGGRLSET